MSDSFFEGMKVGRFEVVTRLSVGGMAELYLARLLGPGGFQKLVALKMILPDVRTDERFVQMFLDEAQLAAELSHPNLGQVFELGQEPTGELYLAMEFLAGQNLSAVLRAMDRAGRRLPIELAATIGRDLCLGLHAAHTHLDALGRPKPVIHRDVAPKNVMVTFDGQVKVIDFGIAMASGRRVRTQTGVVKGTPTYMAPEQLYGDRATPQSDIFSAGVVLHECLTGQRLFTIDLAPQRFGEVIKAPSAVNPLVPEALDEVCLRALAIEPSERFASAKDFARAIADAAPSLAEPEALSSLMTELYGAQRASLGQLIEAAHSEAPRTLSQLAKRAFDAPKATPLDAGGPTASEGHARPPGASPPTSTRASAPVETPAFSPAARRGAVLALGGLVVVGLAVGIGALATPTPPPVDLTAKPIAPPPLAPRPPADPLDRAELLLKTEPAAALAVFDDVLAKHPTNWRALMGSAKALQALGEDERARGRLRRAAEQPIGALDKKDHVLTWGEVAKAELQAKREDAARLALEQALEVDGPLTRALLTDESFAPLLASVADARLQPVSATADVAEAVEQAKRDKSAGRFDSAISVLKECLRAHPHEPDCTAMLASTFATRAAKSNNSRDNDQARVLYREFLEYAPANHRLRERVRRILQSDRNE